MRKIKVNGYSYTRKGKTIMVRPYERKEVRHSGSLGLEYLRRKTPDGFVEFSNWEEFQDAVNEIGWDNMTLFKHRGSKRTEDGRKVYNISDPRGGDPENQYVGLRADGKLVGAANVYVGNDYAEIGDFEIFPKYKGKGYGKRLFNSIRSRYPNRHYLLLYRDNKAKKFWEKMGFQRTGGRIMEADL